LNGVVKLGDSLEAAGTVKGALKGIFRAEPEGGDVNHRGIYDDTIRPNVYEPEGSERNQKIPDARVRGMKGAKGLRAKTKE